MIDDGCYVILGVASGRSRWFASVGTWAAGGSAPIEFIRCVASPRSSAGCAPVRPRPRCSPTPPHPASTGS